MLIFRSADHGLTWDEGTVYVSGLTQELWADIQCDLDEEGVYVAYQAPNEQSVRLILPGDPVTCGNASLEPGEQCDGTDFGEKDIESEP